MKKQLLALITIGVVLLLSAGAGICTESDGWKLIETHQVKKMMAAKEKPLLAFTLSPIEFAIEHIPGSGKLVLTFRIASSKDCLLHWGLSRRQDPDWHAPA